MNMRSIENRLLLKGRKNKKTIITILLALVAVAAGAQSLNKDVERLQYVYSLKVVINDSIWSGFADKQCDVPLLYYGDTCCYVVNPTKKFLAMYPSVLVNSYNDIQIYQTKKVDDKPFHMHVTFTTDEESCVDYYAPIMRCSSLEQTSRTIPDVTSVNEWATMVIHEYFHGFQFKNDGYLDIYETITNAVLPDTLIELAASHDWYRESITQENDLLLKAIDADDIESSKPFIQSFFKLRNERRERVKKELGIDIVALEQLYETMEGSARYIEYCLYRHFGNFNLSDANWLYNVGRKYYYATGFNLLRISDKLKIDYKHMIFKDVSAIEGNLRAAHQR